jgi:Predicted membrane protein (DUF2238)
MTLNNQISRSPTRRGPEPAGSSRDGLSRVERGSVQVAAAAVASFGVYGFATGSPSAVGYVSSVIVIGAAIVWLRRAALPGLLAAGLAIAAIATLAGGLINVGQNVLYNAGIGPYSKTLRTHLLQYDHFAHAYVSFVVAFACWVMLVAPHAGADNSRQLVFLAVGAALGLGALNEMVEFLVTLAHHGAHVGGYWNTGWDLVCNFIGAGAAGLAIGRSHSGAAGPAGTRARALA